MQLEKLKQIAGSSETAPGTSWKTKNELLNVWKSILLSGSKVLAVLALAFQNCGMIDVNWPTPSIISCVQNSKLHFLFMYTYCQNNMAIRTYFTELM